MMCNKSYAHSPVVPPCHQRSQPAQDWMVCWHLAYPCPAFICSCICKHFLNSIRRVMLNGLCPRLCANKLRWRFKKMSKIQNLSQGPGSSEEPDKQTNCIEAGRRAQVHSHGLYKATGERKGGVVRRDLGLDACAARFSCFPVKKWTGIYFIISHSVTMDWVPTKSFVSQLDGLLHLPIKPTTLSRQVTSHCEALGAV